MTTHPKTKPPMATEIYRGFKMEPSRITLPAMPSNLPEPGKEAAKGIVFQIPPFGNTITISIGDQKATIRADTLFRAAAAIKALTEPLNRNS